MPCSIHLARGTCLATVLAATLATAPAAAQEPVTQPSLAPPASALLATVRALRPGIQIRIAGDSMPRRSGEVLWVRRSSGDPTVQLRSGVLRAREAPIQASSIDTLWVRRSVVKKGAVIGAVFPGVVYGVLLASLMRCDIFGPCYNGVAGAARMGAGFAGGVSLGALYGAGIGTLVRRWDRRYPAPAAPAAR